MKKYDVVAVTGTYTNAQGEEKKRYLNCGAVFETEKGLSLKLEGIPVGSEWNGWLSLFEPRNATAKPRQQSVDAPSGGAMEDQSFEDSDIPF